MSSTASIRDQIAQTVRIDYSNVVIHHKLKKHMDIAPILKPYDYQGLLTVINSWFEGKIFKYSVLDYWLEPTVRFYYSDLEVSVQGMCNSFNLKYNSGVCCHLAFKCKHMIDILYPWASCVLIEKQDWRSNGGNHFFLLLPELGVTNDNEFIETNLNFGSKTRFQNITGQSKLHGTVHVVDPTRSIIGLWNNHKLYSTPIISYLQCHIDYSQTKSFIDNSKVDTNHFWYAHRFENEEFGTLGFGYDNHIDAAKEPYWQIGSQKYSFNSTELIPAIHNLDPEAAIKIAILQRRGFIRK